MHDDSRIKSIAIVGGGTAGWVSAAVLRAFLAPEQCRIRVIEAPDIPLIGVGEATVPPLVELIRRLGISESELMRRCSGTWKLGIRFDDWKAGNARFWHPFGFNAGSIDGLPFFYFWLRRKLQGQAGALSDYSPNAVLAEALGSPSGDAGSPVLDSGFYAYHLDATLLAEFLRETCVARGVEHVRDTVLEVHRGDTGITSIDCRHCGPLSADLYLDCTGFRALLAGAGPGAHRIDLGRRLLCDRAVTVALAAESDYPPFTTATALDAGWMWQVPLVDRTGCGYVFSSAHCDDDSALAELDRRVGSRRIDGEARVIPMHIGRLQEPWSRNCVAIGLAACFVEPLESTGIYLIQAGIEKLLKYFPDRGMNRHLARSYNRDMGEAFDEIADFIQLHYRVAGRYDTSFWRDAAAAPPSPRLASIMELYDHTAMVERSVASLFPALSVQTILAGSGRLPEQAPPVARIADDARIDAIMAEVRARNASLVAKMPSHRQALEALHGCALPRPPTPRLR